MKENFVPWLLANESFEDIPEVLAYYGGIEKSMTPIKSVEVFGHISERLGDFVHTLFTYTDVIFRNFFNFEKVRIKRNTILLLSAFQNPEDVLRYLAGFKNKEDVSKAGKRILWLDLHRDCRSEEESLWLQTVLPFCDIVTTGSYDLQVKYEATYQEPYDVYFHTVETIPNVTFKEVGSVLEIEKKGKSPRVMWCGNLEDSQALTPFLEQGSYPVTVMIRDNYNLEHPKITLVKNNRKRALHYSDYLLITQPPSDPYYRQLIKEALIKGVVPLVTKKDDLNSDLNEYTLLIKPINLNKDWLKDIMYMNTSSVEKMLLEGQNFVLNSFTTASQLDSLIELYKACEILLNQKKKDTSSDVKST